MAQQTINTGTAPNDGTGDTLKTSFTKCNANFSELYSAVASPVTPVLGGRLAYIGATQLSFLPMNGDKIKISGTIYTIPGTGAGIAGLANTGIRLNNVPGSSLAADTTYWVFAENVSGTITGHFWTVAGGLAAPHHRPSQTAGNEGVEVWYNGTELPQFTLIGMCRTNASAQFQSDGAFLGVLSWFNRRSITGSSAFTANRSITGAVFIEIDPEIRVNALNWAEEAILFGFSGAHMALSAGFTVFTGIAMDGVLLDNGHGTLSSAAAGYQGAFGGMVGLTASEGFHYYTLFGKTNGTQCQWLGSAPGDTRCSISICGRG